MFGSTAVIVRLKFCEIDFWNVHDKSGLDNCDKSDVLLFRVGSSSLIWKFVKNWENQNWECQCVVDKWWMCQISYRNMKRDASQEVLRVDKNRGC